MLQLILDSSQNTTLIALSQNGVSLDFLAYPHQNKLSSLLTISIQSFLKKHDLSPKDLNSIAVGIGPGSYTGTRSAVSLAKAMALALEIPLIPFCSLLPYIPKEITGPTIFLLETKQDTPFILQLDISNANFFDIKHGILHKEIHPTFASKNLVCFDISSFSKAHPKFAPLPDISACLCIDKLTNHLYDLTRKNLVVSHEDLHSVELIYLNKVNIPPTNSESLPSNKF
jgi:tRNA threonylcarbamoyl adenosine modification protein YeaZ